MKENSTDYITLPRLSIALVALLALGASCTHRETGDDLLQPYELRYKASFRSSAPTWQKNDQMGVFSLSDGVVSDDNILYTSSAGDGVFFSTSPIHRSPSSHLEIIAYYPYTAEASQGQLPMNYAGQAQGRLRTSSMVSFPMPLGQRIRGLPLSVSMLFCNSLLLHHLTLVIYRI